MCFMGVDKGFGRHFTEKGYKIKPLKEATAYYNKSRILIGAFLSILFVDGEPLESFNLLRRQYSLH